MAKVPLKKPLVVQIEKENVGTLMIETRASLNLLQSDSDINDSNNNQEKDSEDPLS